MERKVPLAELEKKRAALEGEIGECVQRESQLKSDCARLEQQGQGLTESLTKTQALLTQEMVGRTAAEQQAAELAELRSVLEESLAASQQQKDDLGTQLKSAQARVAGLEQKQAALEDWIREWAEREARLKSECARLEQQGPGVAGLESKLREEVAHRENWERRAAELEQASASLKAQLQEWMERQDQLKSECVRLEQKCQELAESLCQAQQMLAEKEDSRPVTGPEAGEIVRRRTRPILRPFGFVSQGLIRVFRRRQEPNLPERKSGRAERPVQTSAGSTPRQYPPVRPARRRTQSKGRGTRVASSETRRLTGSNRGPSGRERSPRSEGRAEQDQAQR